MSKIGKKENQINLNIPMCLACILFCLTLITTHLAGGLYAKYTNSGYGNETASSVKFRGIEISETGDFGEDGKIKAIILPGVDLKKNAVINHEGTEVASYIFIEYGMPSSGTYAWQTKDETGNGEPDKFVIEDESEELMSWKPAAGWQYLKTVENGSSEKRFVFYKKVEPNEKLLNDNLIDDNKIIVSTNIKKDKIHEMQGIYIDIRANLIQEKGFENPMEAWNIIEAKGGN